MASILYVIAGDKKEFNDFLLRNDKTNQYPNTIFVYVRSAEAFRGVQNPNGICIGTWKDRPDINEILNNLLIVCRDPSKFERIVELGQLYRAYLSQKTMRIV